MADTGQTDYTSLKEDLSARGVRYLLASYSDMHGVSKSKVVPRSA